MRNFRYLVASIALAGVLDASPARAQRPTEQATLLLAVSHTELPQGVRALVVRTANGTQQDLIVLAPNANAGHTLPGSFALLRRLRIDEPIAHSSQVHYVIHSEGQQPLSPRAKAKFAAQLARARGGERRDIPGIGQVSVIATAAGIR